MWYGGKVVGLGGRKSAVDRGEILAVSGSYACLVATIPPLRSQKVPRFSRDDRVPRRKERI